MLNLDLIEFAPRNARERNECRETLALLRVRVHVLISLSG